MHSVKTMCSCAPTETNVPHVLTCTYPQLVHDLKPGDEAVFADGAVAMRVESVANGYATLMVTLAGRLRSGQGLNLPGTDLRVESLTEKDLRDLDFLSGHAVEYVGLSFARSAADVVRLNELRARNMNTKIVAKIEKPQAVANLESIIAEADAVMVARGDLGVEMERPRYRRCKNRSSLRATVPRSGDHRDPDAQQHGVLEPPDPRRGKRRLQRRARRHRRGDALR